MTRSSQNAAVESSGRKRRVAFLGAGYIADWHAQCIQSVPGVELVAVCDRVFTRAQDLARKFAVPSAYPSLEAMLAAEHQDGNALDSVHILLPPDHHFAAAKTLLEAGVDVLIEKPMCDSADDCDTLDALAFERDLRLGVGHNFLFSAPYESLRHHLHSGILGRPLDVTITWHKPLPQVVHGPFDTWMLRDPRNILMEIGSHSVAHMLDLVGEPAEMRVHPSDPVDLPTGRRFYRRWQIDAVVRQAAVQLRFSFAPGFSESTIHFRGSLAAATVDFERNTCTIDRHRPTDPDFDNYSMLVNKAKSLKRQARHTLWNYVASKLHLRARGNPYGESIARVMDAFYNPRGLPLDVRIDGQTGGKVIRLCEQMAALANIPGEKTASQDLVAHARTGASPRVLVLGGTGFIGKELASQLIRDKQAVRLFVRNPNSIPVHLRGPELEWQVGDIGNRQQLLRAMAGIDCVIHLARANVKSWPEYQEYEIAATRQVAECALEAGVKRLIYAGTIDSYYAGKNAGTISEKTPLDRRIDRRNLYARAKADSENVLTNMHKKQGLPLVIVRPGIVIGRGGIPFHMGVGMWWHDAVCQFWGDGKKQLPLVLVEDVATAVIAAIDTPGIEGMSFNLVADPCLSAQEYVNELERAGGMRVRRHATPILNFYIKDMAKWLVKVAVRHPERRRPSYRDWESRTQRAVFDCSLAKATLGWRPVSDRDEMVRRGIEEPLLDLMK
jgi:nucleoside-diphosphate-sugar epimerase/predicted dehydrogenase